MTLLSGILTRGKTALINLIEQNVLYAVTMPFLIQCFVYNRYFVTSYSIIE